MKNLTIILIFIFPLLSLKAQSLGLGTKLTYSNLNLSQDTKSFFSLNLDFKYPITEGYVGGGADFSLGNSLSSYYLSFESVIYKKFNAGMKTILYDKGFYENKLPKAFGMGLFTNYSFRINKNNKTGIFCIQSDIVLNSFQVEYSFNFNYYFKIQGF